MNRTKPRKLAVYGNLIQFQSCVAPIDSEALAWSVTGLPGLHKNIKEWPKATKQEPKNDRFSYLGSRFGLIQLKGVRSSAVVCPQMPTCPTTR